MRKNYKDKVNRKSFIQLTIDDPKQGAKIINQKARQISRCKNTAQTVKILSELLCITDRTIYNDYTN